MLSGRAVLEALEVMRVIVIGSGAGGATVARELAGRCEVTVLEAGKAFRPFAANIGTLARARSTGLFADPRLIRLLFPSMRIRRARGPKGADPMFLVNASALGGTTTISAGNAVRCDEDLKARGIDLDEEFDELAREVPITVDHHTRWRPMTKRLAEAFTALGLQPHPLPKMGDYSHCRRCGRCVLGCPTGVKWDARRFLDEAEERGARIESGFKVDRLLFGGNEAVGVQARRGFNKSSFAADVVVLAAGGLGTPAILARSGIACEPRLFVDPVLCVAAPLPGSRLDREISMPFVVQREGYIISPYMDWLSFFFNRRWRLPSGDIVSLMIKLADEERGRVDGERVEKQLSGRDRERLLDGVRLCRRILEHVGAPPETHFLGTLNAGHPGGSLPVGGGPDPLHDARLPGNVWVADASLIPASLGRPPILTIMALAKRIARLIQTGSGVASKNRP
jgi:choline dehydrogenase-like flavoprotein